MKKTGKTRVVINIYGDDNQVYLNETRSHLPAIVITAVVVIVAVLAVSYFCPDLCSDLVRWFIGVLISG